VISFGGGLPNDACFPRRLLARAFVRAVRSPALQYGWPEGSEALRCFVSNRLRMRGASVTPEEVIVTSGAQQAIAIAARLACRPGDPVAVGDESYPGALDLFRSLGLPPVVDGGRARYVMPAVDNPIGRSWRLAPLLASRGPLLEDDAYAELRFDGRLLRPLLAEARDRVWHIGTFSKTLCPGLRVGWLVPPKGRFRRALRLKRDGDLQAGGLAQAVLEDYLASVDWEARLIRLRRFYRARAARLMEALHRHLPSWRFREPEGGFALWVEPDGEGDDAALLAIAVEEGVSFDPGRCFRPNFHLGERAPLALRICFSAVAAGAMDEGVRRLARAWAKLRRREAGRRHDPGRTRVGRRRLAAGLRTLRPRPRPRPPALDTLLAPVGGASTRLRRGARLP
jgi:2-aminoadipate transaminase